ncbi:MAG: YihY/virulence factor BrkB family protein [Planctomycetota bacterium]
MKLIDQTISRIRRLLTQPLGELNRWQLAARYAVGVVRYGAHELREDRASQMAAALTYRTIFSLVPTFVLSLLVFNAFGGFQSVGGDLQETIYGYLGLDVIAIENTEGHNDTSPAEGPAPEPTPDAGGAADADAGGGEAAAGSAGGGEAPGAGLTGAENGNMPSQAETKAQVDQLLADLQEQVASVDFGTIGVVGLAVLIWAALSLVVSLENCLNRVYHAPQGRPWHLRITIYWATITLGPVLLAVGFYLTNQVVGAAESVSGVGWVVSVLTPFASLAVTWLLLLLVYMLLPNARVQFRAALIGAAVAAVLWEGSKLGFGLYVKQAVGYSALYGSLGLVPLFLLWLYVTWMVILFGLEISYVTQTVNDTRFLWNRTDDDGGKPMVDGRAVLGVAAELGRAFADGEGRSAADLGSAAGLPGEAAETLAKALCSAGLARRLEGDDDGPGDFVLARPAESIPLGELLAAGRDTAATGRAHLEGAARDALDKLRSAEDQAVDGVTLRSLIKTPETET